MRANFKKQQALVQGIYYRWYKILADRVQNKKIRQGLLQALPFWVAALVAGIAAVFYTKLFTYFETLSLSIVAGQRWMLFILTPGCFLLAWWVVKRFDPKAGGSGIPQVMAAIELATAKHNYLVDSFLSIKIIVVKVLSTLLMIFGGGAIGREGPTVQIAGSIFRLVNNILPASWPKISKKNMIMTGAAAGLAAAFNTPLGGIVFAVEELSKTHINNFKTALFTGVILAGITAQGFLGPYLYLGYPNVNDLPATMIFSVLLVACIAGITGSIMSSIILKIIKWQRNFKDNKSHVLYVLSCGLVIAGMAYFLGDGILGSGKQIMGRVLFSPDKHVGIALPFYRVLGSVAAFTTGAAGGIFAPSLGAGATIGAAAAELFKLSPSEANMLILSGMVAFLTGVTRSPFTSAILVLEMTDRHSVVFYLMVAGMVAGLVSNLVDRHSLYDHLKDIYLDDAYTLQNPEASTAVATESGGVK